MSEADDPDSLSVPLRGARRPRARKVATYWHQRRQSTSRPEQEKGVAPNRSSRFSVRGPRWASMNEGVAACVLLATVQHDRDHADRHRRASEPGAKPGQRGWHAEGTQYEDCRD